MVGEGCITLELRVREREESERRRLAAWLRGWESALVEERVEVEVGCCEEGGWEEEEEGAEK